MIKYKKSNIVQSNNTAKSSKFTAERSQSLNIHRNISAQEEQIEGKHNQKKA